MSSKYLRNLFHIFSLFPNGIDIENQLFEILSIIYDEDNTEDIETEISDMINQLEEKNCIEQVEEGVYTLLEHNWIAFIMLYNMNKNDNQNSDGKKEKQKNIEKKPIKKDRIVDVKSFTDKGQSYQVNLDKETCSCPDFKYRGSHICKHIETIANNPSKYGLTEDEVEEFCENIESEKPSKPVKAVKAVVRPVKANWEPNVKKEIKKAIDEEESQESDEEYDNESDEEYDDECDEEYQPQSKRQNTASRSSTRVSKPVQKKFVNYQNSQIHPIQKTVQQLVKQVVQQAQQTQQQVQQQVQQVQQQVQDFVKPFVQPLQQEQKEEEQNDKDELVNSPAQQLFQQNTIVQPVKPIQPIINSPSDNIIDIPSFSDPNMKYQVNTTQGNCSCPDFKYRGPIICKHIDAIVNNPTKYNLTQNDATDLEKKFSRKQN